MKLHLRLFCVALVGTVTAGRGATLLTFDTLPSGTWPAPGYSVIPNGYGGLNWRNFGVLDGYNLGTDYGYHTGVVSPYNVAFNIGGTTASINAVGGVFSLQSGYLTAALNLDTPLNLRVQGFLGAAEVYDNSYTLNRTAPTFISFNSLDVDRVTFDSSPEFQPFALDNLTVVVPEPSTTALAMLAAAAGSCIGRRTGRSLGNQRGEVDGGTVVRLQSACPPARRHSRTRSATL